MTLIYDLLERRGLRWGYVFSSLLAVIGAAVIRYDHLVTLSGQGDSDSGAAGEYLLCHRAGRLQRLMEVHPLGAACGVFTVLPRCLCGGAGGLVAVR